MGEPDTIPEHIVPFLDKEAEIIEGLAAQAAILIERSQLFDEIEELLESFTVSLVTALDQRDPITAGHSKRVTEYALSLAHKVAEADYGHTKIKLLRQRNTKKCITQVFFMTLERLVSESLY